MKRSNVREDSGCFGDGFFMFIGEGDDKIRDVVFVVNLVMVFFCSKWVVGRFDF